MTDANAVWHSFVERYRDDPAGFSENVIKMAPLPWQREVMEAIASGERRLSVKSGHGIGKSSCAAAIILWYLLTRYPVRVVVTAPTASQLYDALFAEVKSRLREMPEAIGKLLEATSDRIVLKANPPAAFCVCKTAAKEKPESLAGVHVREPGSVLLIADEASGIVEEVYESAAGSMSGANACTLLLGNPIRSSGFFYRTHTELSDDWWTKTVSCADSPLVSADFIEDMEKRYGKNSNAFLTRVLGEFPLADEDTYIPLHLIEASINREVEESPVAPIVWGLDVARRGSDKSALAKRKGNMIVEMPKTWRDKSTMELSGIILNEYEAANIMDRPSEILVDVIGIGAGVVDRLIELDLPARGINVAESASVQNKYLRLRDELWGRAREFFEARECVLPDDARLVSELAAPRFTFTSSGKVKIESKDEMRKRGIQSPDIADAFCLTFASTAVSVAHGSRYAWSQNITVDTRYVV
tara:strand:- start:30 stop:1445 length:1416 start_codon:yes stop_codon:yes gene_type:complete